MNMMPMMHGMMMGPGMMGRGYGMGPGMMGAWSGRDVTEDDVRGFLDVARSHDARAGLAQHDALGAFAMHTQRQ